MIQMIRTSIENGLRFEYVLVDSWFTCYELIRFINSRRINCNLIGMAKMGKTRYSFKDKNLTAKQIIEIQRRTKKVKRSRFLK